MHVRGYQCTTASMVADLPADPDVPLRVWAALGSPCVSAYLPVGVVDGRAVVPSVLGSAEAWRAFRALGAAAERPGAEGEVALHTIRAALAPIEATAWDEADDLWQERADVGRWRVAADAWDERITAVVRSLLGG